MLATVFVTHVKAKLNRLDSNAYEDIRMEEILFFANTALKMLTLAFDMKQYPQLVDKQAARVYLASLTAKQTELALTSNKVALPEAVLKFKSVEVEVTIGSETGWVSTGRELEVDDTSEREDNPFLKSFPDTPVYRLIGEEIEVLANGFTANKIRYDYLMVPPEITNVTDITLPFILELEDKTVTLILETIENQRLQTQPVVSRS